MKKRMLRALSFVLAICMVVISVDMPVVATGYDDVAEQLDETIVYEESMEDSCEIVDSEESTENSEETIIFEEMSDFSEEETGVSENAEIPDEKVDSDEMLVQEEITILEGETIRDYNDIVAMEVIAVDFEEIEDSIDADVLIEQYYEGPVVYAAEEAQDCNWDNYTDYYIYNLLTADEKKLWDALEIECNKYMEEEIDLVHNTTYSLYHMAYVSIETTEIDAARLQELVHLFLYTHPQYYFLRNGMMYGMSSSSIRVGITGYDKFADGSERKAITNTINALLEDWYAQIDLCTTDEEKILLIHDLICNKVNYNDAIVEDGYITQEEEIVAFSQTAYSVFCMDETVCAGYSKAFSWVCNGVGIDNFCVTSPTHAWNKVRVNGSWYNLDSTWNDDDTGVYYYYFMRDDDVFSGSSHGEESVWEEYLPACTLDSGSTWSKAGKLPSVTAQVAKPVISVTREDITYKVTISTETPNARIYYTLDGTNPSEAGTKSLIYTVPFEVTGEVEIKAIAVCNEYLDSEVSLRNTADVVYIVSTGTCGANITWSLDSAGHMVISGTGDMTNYYNLEDVPWYEYIEDIKALEIQDGVTSIGAHSFWWAINLQSVSIANTVEAIYGEAFASSGLVEVVIPASVKELGNAAFCSCESLEKVEFKGNIEKIDRNVFSSCVNLKTIILPDDFTCIGESMFGGAYALENITLPSGLKAIEADAFEWCKKLKKITVPNSVTQIGDYAFYHCYAMEEAVIEADITTLPIGMFSNCTSLKTVVLPEDYTNIPDYFMESCENIMEFTIPETVTSIGKMAFYNTGITEISIPKTVTSIGEKAFYSTGITEISIPDSVTSISEDAFEPTVSIIGYPGSAAEQYALENGNEFIDITEGAISVTFVTDCDIVIKPQYFFETGYVTEPTKVYRAGYTFDGWYTSVTTQGENTAWDFANDKVAEDVVLYAKWTPNTYILSFDPNYDGAEAIESREIIYDAEYGELPKLTRTGYSFNGWYSAETPEYSGEYIQPNSIYKVDGNQTLYAVWGKHVYTVKYDANGGTASYNEDWLGYDDTIERLPRATREGYTFVGWFSEPEGGEEYKIGTVMNITATTTIYAHWEANEYTVALEPNGATLDEKEITVTYGSAYGELPTLEKEGYRFKGWMLEDGTVVTASTIVETAKDHTLYASWQARVYTVILSAGEGSVTPSSKSATFGNEYGELPIPQRVGYSFVGWYTDQTEGELISADSVVTIAKDHALFARYEANRYIITFELNGGLLDTNEIVVTYDSAYGTLPVPEQAGCTFAGWYTASEGGEQITAESLVEVAENHTLYARWEYKYTVETPLSSIADGSEVKTGTKLYLTSETYGARIYYTTDNEIGVNVSAENGILYEDAIVIDEDVTVYAIAVKEQCNSSEVMVVSYTVADESQDWGDITETDRAEYGFADATQVPQALWMAGVPEDCDYIGKAITFEDLHVYSHKTLLQPKVDYTVKYSNNVKAGTATITITGKGNYAGTIIRTFTINPLDLSDATLLDVTLPYTGKVQKSTTTVTYMLNGKIVTLKAGTDFTYTYPGTNNKLADYDSNAFKAAGDHIVTITGKGNYTGTNTFTEVITQKYVIGKMRLTSITNQKYTGSEIEPEVKIYNGNKRMVEGVDYTVEYSNNIAVGKATVTITGMGDYEGVRTATFNITGTALSKMKFSGFKSTLPWTGTDVKQDITFSYTTGKGANAITTYLEEGIDYTVSYSENIRDIGKVTVVYTGIGGYTGTIKKTYQITGLSISRAKVSGLETTMVYDGKSMTQSGYELTYTTGSGATAVTTPLIENEDYKVSYSANHKVGTATIIFTGINGYTGTLKKTYKITAYNIATVDGKISVSEIPEQIYTKGGSTPKPVITYTNDEGIITLAEGKDYTLRYSNHNAVADKTALRAPTLTITGKGNFKGNYVVKYTITGSALSYTTMTANDIVYQNKAGICKPSIVLVDTNGKKLAAGTDYNRTISYTYAIDVKVTQLVNRKYIDVVRMAGDPVDTKDIIPVGAEITATVTGINKYAGTQSVTFRYITKNISSASVTVAAQIYTGDAVEPAKDDIVVKIGKIVLNKTDYEIVGYSNNIKKGTAKVIIRGIGNYGGEKTVSFKINVKSLNYTIHYVGNAENVTGKMNASSVTISKLLTANAYRRKGYVFEGWNTKPDGSGISYSNREKFYLKDGVTVYGTEITLYAQWSEL